MDKSNIMGDIHVLTPTQKREQERLRKEQEEKEAAKKRKREEAKLEKERQKQAKKSSYIIIMIISFVCTLGWVIFGALQEYNDTIVIIVATLLALPCAYVGAKLGEGKY